MPPIYTGWSVSVSDIITCLEPYVPDELLSQIRKDPFVAESYDRYESHERAIQIESGQRLQHNVKQSDVIGYIKEIYYKKTKKTTIIVVNIAIEAKRHDMIVLNNSKVTPMSVKGEIRSIAKSQYFNVNLSDSISISCKPKIRHLLDPF